MRNTVIVSYCDYIISHPQQSNKHMHKLLNVHHCIDERIELSFKQIQKHHPTQTFSAPSFFMANGSCAGEAPPTTPGGGSGVP